MYEEKCRVSKIDDYLSGKYIKVSLEEEISLIKKSKEGCSKSGWELVTRNTPFILFHISKNFKRSMPPDMDSRRDVYQEGTLSFYNSIGSFDVNRNVRFITYASNNLYWNIKDFLASSRTILSGNHLYLHDNGRTEDGSGSVQKIYYRRGENDISIVDHANNSVPDNFESDIVNHIHIRNQIDTVLASIKELDEKLRMVLYRRFALEGHKQSTLQEIADDIGYSKEGVRILEKRALKIIRVKCKTKLSAFRESGLLLSDIGELSS